MISIYKSHYDFILDFDYLPFISIADLKEAMKGNSTNIRDAKLSKLRQRLDEIIEE